MIRQIEKEELRKMHDREGLILQGCGGELKEWTEGINQILEQEGILPKGKRLDDVAVFRNEGMTNLLFFFGEEKPDIGKLAAWRLKTRYQFGSMWMSDYVNNRLGGFLRENVTEKPNCTLIGEDGNIFNLMKSLPAHCGKTAWMTRRKRWKNGSQKENAAITMKP